MTKSTDWGVSISLNVGELVTKELDSETSSISFSLGMKSDVHDDYSISHLYRSPPIISSSCASRILPVFNPSVASNHTSRNSPHRAVCIGAMRPEG